MDKILEVNKLTKVFNQRNQKKLTALDQVSFTLDEGEILGIVGESGSGKSTIAKLITRLMDVTDGTIILDGIDITKTRGGKLREAYAKVQMVFQTPSESFDPRKTIGYGIGESLRNQGLPKEQVKDRVEQLLTCCGMKAEYATRYPHEISGGQCQRAAIARALACNPKMIILDEATSALDVTVQKQIMELLIRLQKENGLSYIFICHNLALVQQFCHRVIVLWNGKIVEEGKPDDVIMNPKSEYAKKLVYAVFDV